MAGFSFGDVLDFWRNAGPSRWFRKDAAFDDEFRTRLLAAHDAAMRGELDHWQSHAQGSLALLILLDQFPRNAFRGTPRMFESDARAREVARSAVDQGFDLQFEPQLRNFFYLPFMHSEQLADQERCVALTAERDPDSLKWAQDHREIIAKFRRFPHRNAVLGRATTPEEQAFLDAGGFAG